MLLEGFYLLHKVVKNKVGGEMSAVLLFCVLLFGFGERIVEGVVLGLDLR